MDNYMNKLTDLKYDSEFLSHLTRKYFDATISESEQKVLSQAAQAVEERLVDTSGWPDGLLEELRMIHSIDNFSAVTISHLASRTPIGLEQRLNDHISALASESRHSFRMRRIFTGVAAAASIAIMTTLGLHFINDPESQTDLSTLPSTPSMQSQQATIISSNPGLEKANLSTPTKESIAKATSSEEMKNKSTVIKPSKSNMVNINKDVTEKIEPNPEATRSSKIILPAFSEQILQVMPVISQATIDPSRLMLNSNMAFSQSIDALYESLNIVSNVFSGMKSTVGNINNDFSKAMDSSMQVI